MTSPACVAETVQVPAAISVKVIPVTLQVAVVLEKLTGNEELAVATKLIGNVVTDCGEKVANAIDCGVFVILNDRVMAVAAA